MNQYFLNNVASIDLCRQLYKMSGADDTFAYYYDMGGDNVDLNLNHKRPKKIGEPTIWGIYWPAYDLYYLLDKLTEIKPGLTLYHNHSLMQWECFYAGKFFDYNYPVGNRGEMHFETMDENPANAVAKMAIQLFKQNALARELFR